MALSRITKIAPGGSNTFAVAFALGYGNQADVTARVGTEVDGLGAPVYRTINFSVPGFMTLSGATVTAGTAVVFERTENRTTLDVNWLDGANITDDNLNAAQLQYMRLIHEALDGRFEGITQDLDMAVHQIHNVVDPTFNQDVATKYYVDQRIVTATASATAAAGSAAAAAASQGAAATSATNSATSATNATTQYNLAVGQVTIATAQAGLASGYRTDSLTYSNNSAASAVLAQKWANELEDVVVAGGLYSAYHWAQKAAAVVAGGFLSAFHASPSKATLADTDELPIWNSVGGVVGRLTWANLKVNVLAYFNATAKATPIDADRVWQGDSTASNAPVYSTWTQVKAFLKTYFDTVYALAAHTHTFASLTSKPTTLSGYGITDGIPTFAAVTAKPTTVAGYGITNVMFTQAYTSAAQVITAGGQLVLAHGLGVKPPLYKLFMKCVTAEMGYAVGEEVAINQSVTDAGSQSRGFSIRADATNITVQLGGAASNAYLMNASSGSPSLITNANWNVIVRAWA